MFFVYVPSGHNIGKNTSLHGTSVPIGTAYNISKYISYLTARQLIFQKNNLLIFVQDFLEL